MCTTAPVAIVHHRDHHRDLAWRPIPQPRQTGSPEGGCYRAGEVLRKSTRVNYGKRVSRTTQKTAHRVHRVPYLPLCNRLRIIKQRSSNGGNSRCQTWRRAGLGLLLKDTKPQKKIYYRGGGGGGTCLSGGGGGESERT